MFAPATASEVRRAPLCPACLAPMTLFRAVTPAASDGLRVFQCVRRAAWRCSRRLGEAPRGLCCFNVPNNP
jgi:hypothetical protein